MDMERMERVLRRVRGEQPPAEGDDRGELAALIHAERRSRDSYGKLRARCSGQCRLLLTQLWTEEEQHLQALQEQYLLLTGDTLPLGPGGDEPPYTGVVSALRHGMEAERRGAEAYRQAAERTQNRALRQLYEAHAQAETRHAARLEQMLHRALGK